LALAAAAFSTAFHLCGKGCLAKPCFTSHRAR
jgi:hypothetical protein